MKIAMFTDIHWGAKGNSIQHNEDCIAYVKWFISNLRKQKCDTIVFMGDWFENRNSINVQTLNMSYDGLKMLNDLGMPIYFCIGNHDLYHRSNRQLYSTYHYEKFSNVKLVSDPLVENDMIFFPYLFKEEYPQAAALINKNRPKYVFGHFEFKDFVVTGSDRRIDHGPDHRMFSGPDYLFSGHFHKRQITDNVIYIGNVFPTNYGDVWDDERGMCTLDVNTSSVEFIDWKECPKYRKVKLSDVLSDPSLVFPEKCRVRCLIDVEIGYSEAQTLKEEFIKQLSLREFSLEENIDEKNDAISGEDSAIEFDIGSLNEAVIKMLQTGISGTTTIEPQRLIEIYNQL